MELRYFAWIRERIGLSREEYSGEARTLAELLDELEARGEGYEAALCEREAVHCAIDLELSGGDASIVGAREVAIFPPMTGG